METNLQLEASKAELARQILNIDNVDVLNSIRQALGRALQRQDKAILPPDCSVHRIIFSRGCSN